MPKIEIRSNDRIRTAAFNAPLIRIGRQADNDIVLDDAVASRHHCVILQDKGTFRLKDLKSHNGTWLGENRVIEAAITYGDTIRIGRTLIRLLPDEAQSESGNARAKTPYHGQEEPRASARAAHHTPARETASKPGARAWTSAVDREDETAELPVARGRRASVSNAMAVRMAGGGPLAQQLGPLMQACMNVPVPEGSPETTKDIRLLNKKLEAVHMKARSRSKPAEALDAVRQLLYAAFRTRATDIHIEPKAEVFAIRFRIDGALRAVGEITAPRAVAILNVIKVLCQIDIAKRNVVQEGSFSAELPNRRVDFRVSLTPTVHGQKLALRLLDKAAVPNQFENLGMDLDMVAELEQTCEQDGGMIILSGPTGSGKTTTLYTALQTIDAQSRNIVTIEDPVEYELADTTQISIDPAHHLTFASVLGSVLRQDPDVILVGEIRDHETAKMAMQAATTGHLVLTTLHARDTVGTVFRLLDLGVEPFLIANSVTLCIAQRLVRVLCRTCKRPYRPGVSLVRRLKLEDRPHGDFYQAVGCKRCMETGYHGRMALFEMLVFSQQIRDVILTKPTISELRKAGGQWMFRTLSDSGLSKVIEGITTVEEVERVAGIL